MSDTSGVYDDFGNLLNTSLAQAFSTANNTAINSGNNSLGSTDLSAIADNSGNTSAITGGNLGSTNTTALADNSGNVTLTGQNTGSNTSTTLPPVTDLASLTKWLNDNKGIITAGGALLGLTGANSNQTTPTGYQGKIPMLTATRNMITAPPPTGYRPGQGGINYGGDVSYTRTPGVDPWWQLSGNSAYAGAGGSNDSGLTALLKAYQSLNGGSNLTSLNNSVVTANNTLLTTNNQNTAAITAAKAATAAQTAAAQAAAKAAADLAAAQAAGNAAAIAAAAKAASDAAAAKAAADAVAAKAKADAIAAAKAASEAAAAKAAADLAAADAAAKAKAKADADAAAAKAAADAKTAATEGSFLTAASTVKKLNSPVASANDINSWILNNPNASASEIAAAIKAGNVSNTDIQNALSLSTFSPAVQYSILNGQGLDKLNSNITQWVNSHPYATAAEIAAIKKASGVSDQDVANALTEKTASAGKEYALTHGMGLDEYYQNILDFQAGNHSAAETAAAAKAAGVSQADIDAAAKFAKRQKEIDEWNAQNAPTTQATTQATTEKAPDLNASIAAILADKKATTPDMNSSLASILAERKAATETPNLDSSLSAILAERKAAAQESTPDLNSSLSDILAERKATQEAATQEETPNLDSSLAAILAEMKAAETPSKPDNSNDIFKYFSDPETQAALASGNTRGIAETMQSLGWSPAEVASATGSNPDEVQAAYDAAISSNKAQSYDPYSEAFAEGGMAKGRYLQGGTDGMADEIPAQIGQNQPAALSHGEFVIPADVVSHMGNGNSDAGAKKLYQMMDKIRMARTGTKKQGKKINPEKFMPGGLASSKFAAGGSVKHFLTGGSTTLPAGTTGTESSLSNWGGDYIANMLGQGQALANMPYQQYMGQLTAGESPLQSQAFTAAGALSTPTSIGSAAGTAGDIATKAAGLSYSPTTSTNQFAPPTAYSPTNATNQFTAPTGIPEATNFTNQYTNTGAYTPTTSDFNQTQLQSYMNPYLNKILDPQLDEARRQSQITQQQNAAKMTQAGAYGGSRQAILDAENQRNLGTNLANITGQGYNTAYTNATNQFNADQTRKMQEAQFGATQGMNAAQLQAQYGLSAQQANEMARQFGAQQAMTGAQQTAQYGQSAQQQNELARQFAAQQGMTSAQQQAQYGLASQQANEASKQFGANYGLQGLQAGLQAAQAQGTLGNMQSQIGLNNLNAQLGAGSLQRGIEAEGIAADKAAFEEARANPYKMVQYQQSLLSGLPLAAQSYNVAQPSAYSNLMSGATTAADLLAILTGQTAAKKI